MEQPMKNGHRPVADRPQRAIRPDSDVGRLVDLTAQ
jgi:hypothetical protein